LTYMDASGKEFANQVIKTITSRGSTEIEIPLQLTYMDASGKEFANQVIKTITSRGSTDLCGGLLMGIDLIQKRMELRNDVASVLLFTDGLANCGIQNTDSIVTEMGKKAKLGGQGGTDEMQVDLPCSVHTFGFGSDHDENMLKAIADKGRGIYFFVENKDSIADAFADCLGGLLSVVAQNITLELHCIDGITINNVNTSYKHTKLDNNRYSIVLGDIQSEEARDILCSIHLPSLNEPCLEKQSLLTVTLSYFNVITAQQEDIKAIAIVGRPQSDLGATPNQMVDRQKNRIITADAIALGKELGDQTKYADARKIIEKAIETLKNSISAEDEFVKSLLTDLSNSLVGLQDRHSYTTGGGQTMTSCSSAHYQQRSTTSTTTYSTSARVTMLERTKLDQ